MIELLALAELGPQFFVTLQHRGLTILSWPACLASLPVHLRAVGLLELELGVRGSRGSRGAFGMIPGCTVLLCCSDPPS